MVLNGCWSWQSIWQLTLFSRRCTSRLDRRRAPTKHSVLTRHTRCWQLKPLTPLEWVPPFLSTSTSHSSLSCIAQQSDWHDSRYNSKNWSLKSIWSHRVPYKTKLQATAFTFLHQIKMWRSDVATLDGDTKALEEESHRATERGYAVVAV